MTKTIAWAVAALALAAALIWGALWWQRQPAPVIAAPPPAAQAPDPAPPAPAAPQIEYPIERAQLERAEPAPQVTLDTSDAAVGDAFARLLKDGKLPEWLVPTSLVRNIVATVDNLPRQKSALRLRPVRTMPGAFSIISAGDDRVMAPDNSARYAPFMALVRAVDSKQLVALYVRFYPLFQQAYRDLGYPEGYFNDRLVFVIDHLLDTPAPKTPIELVQPKVQYQFADPELEALSSGQKAMIRVGPDHTAVLKAKLREIRSEVARK